MKTYRRISLWCWISLLVISGCKKELNGDFDPVLGTWNWYKTNKKEYNSTLGTYTGTITWDQPLDASESYKLEVLKKGIIKLYKNNSLERKYKVKNYIATYTDYSSSSGYSFWTYEFELNKKMTLGFKYYLPGDSLTMGFFPYESGDREKTGYSYDNIFYR